MKKDRHFRAVLGTCMCFLIAIMVWWRADWSAIQVGCFTVMLLASGALLVNDHRNEDFHHAATIPLVAALLVSYWTPTRDIRQGVINFVISSIWVWFAMKPYYIKWKRPRIQTETSGESPQELETKSNA